MGVLLLVLIDGACCLSGHSGLPPAEPPVYLGPEDRVPGFGDPDWDPLSDRPTKADLMGQE